MTISMTIAQAAAATGLSVHTLRYYERVGLLDPVGRRANSHRIYTQEDLNWIAFLLKLKSTGLPVRAMLRYAELRRLGNTPESVMERKAILQSHTLCVQQTLAELQSNLAVLHHKIAFYGELEREAQSSDAPRQDGKRQSRSAVAEKMVEQAVGKAIEAAAPKACAKPRTLPS